MFDSRLVYVVGHCSAIQETSVGVWRWHVNNPSGQYRHVFLWIAMSDSVSVQVADSGIQFKWYTHEQWGVYPKE
jgi:hypothetical protein